MKKKFLKIFVSILMPAILFCAGVCAVSSFNVLGASALSGNGGIVFVGNNSTFNMTNGSLSGGSATNGGAVYVALGGTFVLSGGTISGNEATANGGGVFVKGTFNMSGGTISLNHASGNSVGDNIYVEGGVFTMTGGEVGSATAYGGIDCEGGTLNLFGGTVYDDVYSSSTINTKMSATLAGYVTLGDNATIVVQDYAGETPEYSISVSASRSDGTLITFVGADTEPDISVLNVSGFDEDAYELKTQKDSNGNWTVVLLKTVFDFPSTWKTEVASSDYMSSIVTPANLTSIKFVSSVPTGYTQIGTLSTGLPVYQGTTATDIAFVGKKIYAPENCYQLFYNLTKLTSIEFETFNTPKVTNMSYMFYNCSSLISLGLGGFNTSNVANMQSMFYNCTGLTSLDVSGFDTSKVTNISFIFSNCTSLTSLDVGGFNTSNVTTMQNMFSYCKGLTSLDVSGFNTSKVTNMSYMFNYCSNLVSLDVSNFDTFNVIQIGGLFLHCSKLKEIDVSHFNTSNVNSMAEMFVNCSSLTTLDVSNFDTSNVRSFLGMFKSCSKLTSLDLSNFNTSKATGMNQMFSSCSALSHIDLSSFDTSNVTDMSEMFSHCSALSNIDLSNFNTAKVTNMKDMFFYYGGSILDLSNFNTSNVTNMYRMFNDCSNLKTLDLSNFDTSKVTDMRYMFGYCSSLKTLDISSFNLSKISSSNLTDMLKFNSTNRIELLKTPYGNKYAIPITTGSTLYDEETGDVVTSVPANTAKSLTYVNESPIKGLPLAWQSEFSSMAYMDTKDLTSIKFVSSVPTGYIQIGTLSTGLKVYIAPNTNDIAFVAKKIYAPENSEQLFYNLVKLTSFDFETFETSNVANMQSMFSNCTSLTSLDVSGFNTSNVNNMNSIFYGCSGLTSLDIRTFDTSNVTNMDSMFSCCSGLTSLDIRTFNTSNVESMSYMFLQCSGLTSLDLRNFDTTKVENMMVMFSGCSGLKMLDVSSFNMAKVTNCGPMFDFGSTNKIETLKTPYGNTSSIDITTGSTLYNAETGAVVTSVPAKSTKSITLVHENPFLMLPTTWKTEIASADFMTTTVVVSNIERLLFLSSITPEYMKIGTLSTGLNVYRNVYYSNYIAFYSDKTIYAPVNCSQLFSDLSVKAIYFYNFDTTKTTNMMYMFASLPNLEILDLSRFNMSNVTSSTSMLVFGSSNKIGRILTPYNNKSALAISSASTLYNTSTNASVTGVSANTTSSQTFARKVTVTFNPYNGSTPSQTTYTRYYGEKFGSGYPSTSRSGFTFEGWYTQISGGSSINSYILVGDTTFYAHWADSSSGTDPDPGPGPEPDPEPTFPSGFERKHEESQFDGTTLDEAVISDMLSIFDSIESNTFTREDVKIFSIVSSFNDNALYEYVVEEEYGGLVKRLSYNSGNYVSLLSSEWIMSIHSDSTSIGFDQWYYFDSMFFAKIGEIFPNLETLDLRGLDTTAMSFTFRLPDSVQNVIVPEGLGAAFVSTHDVQFFTPSNEIFFSIGFGGPGYSSSSEGLLVGEAFNNELSAHLSIAEINAIKGLVFLSVACPEQLEDFDFRYEYGVVENEIYLCLVSPKDSFVGRFNFGDVGEIYLALVSYTAEIRILQSFIDYDGFSYISAQGSNLLYVDARGMSVTQIDGIPPIATIVDMPAMSYVIVPSDYDGASVTFNGILVNPDGTVRNFLAGGENNDSGNLEIIKGKLFTMSAENVDLYVDDKKWFDPRKNKIQIKTQNDGGSE